jgi:hypothetical protein
MTSQHEDEKSWIKSAQKETDEKKKRARERRSLFDYD